MGAISQPIQVAEQNIPIPPAQTPTSNRVPAGLRRLKTSLKMLAGLLIAPVFLVIALLSFPLVLADFALFRLHDLRDGHPHAKGLWEF